MGQLDRTLLLAKKKPIVKKVDLGDDEYVFVKAMTGHERDVFEQSIIEQKFDNKGNYQGNKSKMEDFRAKLAVVTLCDEEGELLLKPEDYALFSRRISIVKLEKIIEAANELNKISEKDKEDLTKNSEAAPDGNSNSGSVENLE